MDHKQLAHTHYELTFDPDFILNLCLKDLYRFCILLPSLSLLSSISDLFSSVYINIVDFDEMYLLSMYQT